jgi:hypothetical protein
MISSLDNSAVFRTFDAVYKTGEGVVPQYPDMFLLKVKKILFTS